jgi:hypothetical protein
MRERERDDVCICGVARDTKKSPHVPQQMKVRRNWLGEYFSRSPQLIKPKTLNSYNTKKFFLETKTQQTHQHATTMRDDEHD